MANPATEVKATPYRLLFTIMSYNVLAQDLLQSHPHLYYGHDHMALKWEYRSQILLSEIQEANADVRIDCAQTLNLFFCAPVIMF
jgi:mRNA deadenylase 3'-5' endonuclease subunit Ccr4